MPRRPLRYQKNQFPVSSRQSWRWRKSAAPRATTRTTRPPTAFPKPPFTRQRVGSQFENRGEAEDERAPEKDEGAAAVTGTHWHEEIWRSLRSEPFGAFCVQRKNELIIFLAAPFPPASPPPAHLLLLPNVPHWHITFLSPPCWRSPSCYFSAVNPTAEELSAPQPSSARPHSLSIKTKRRSRAVDEVSLFTLQLSLRYKWHTREEGILLVGCVTAGFDKRNKGLEWRHPPPPLPSTSLTHQIKNNKENPVLTNCSAAG